jgi:hypothetical protein
MGRSLHNKIYLGRRHMLLNAGRVRLVASCVAAIAATGLILTVFKSAL